MLGTKDKPGPITSMLRSSADQTAAYNDMLKGGYSPVENQPQYSGFEAPTSLPYSASIPGASATPTYTFPLAAAAPAPTPGANAIVNDGAAKGGIMSLQGYAKGKTVARQTPLEKALARKKAGTKLSATDTALINAEADNASKGGLGVVTLKGNAVTIEPPARPTGQTTADYEKTLQEYTTAGYSLPKALKTQFPNVKTTGQKEASENLKNTIGTSIKAPVADVKAKKDEAGNITGYESTNADFLALQKKARELETPGQYDTATEMYKKSTAGLEAAAGYKPTDVSATKADVAGAEATGYQAQNMAAPSDIAAQKADVATMQGAGNVSSDQLKQYQMQGPGAINAPTATAAQMAGPKSYLDQGTSEAYMSPYMQNVVDIQKRESNRDYEQELNKLNAQSVQAGAFGGSRQAIQQAEAARNQATRLGDIQAKGQQEAYASGMGQFNTETAATTDVGKANLATEQQTTLANQAAQIQAMMANQGMDYNTALQNLQAQMGIQNTQAGNDLQAALANQQTQQQTQSTNMGAQNQASQAYVQQALAAAQANQGTALTAAQQNQVAQNAAAQYAATNQQGVNLATQQAQNTANQQYTTQDLAAQQANQQAGLTGNQQGIGALQGVGQNAAGLTSTGTAANQAGIANLGVQGQVTQAEQALSQQGMTANQQTAQNALDFTNQANAGVVAGVNSQPVQGGTTVGTATAAPATPFGGARGGLIRNGKVSKRGVK
jgi:hypothetical protein